MRAALLLPFLLAAAPALAGQAAVDWQAPTQNCDGTPLTDLSGYLFTWGEGARPLPLDVRSQEVKGLTPGKWWFAVAAVNAAGTVSNFATAEKTVAPEEFVTVSTVVYTAVKRTDKFILLPVGTVPMGTQCNPGVAVNGKYGVPRAAVTWSGSVRPDVVVGDCG
jgi:hypothetical protein